MLPVEATTDHWLASNRPQIEYLIRNGIAGTLAFLTAAAESMPGTTCGDGMVQGGEACDDGNGSSGDGCSSCQVELHFECDGKWPSSCSTDDPCVNGCF